MSKTITLHGITLTSVTGIAPGLWSGRDTKGAMRIFTNQYFRGYVYPHPTPKNPTGFVVQAWPHDRAAPAFRRSGYRTQRGAERQLIARAIAMHGEA